MYHLGQGCFLLSVWVVVAAYDAVLHYNSVVAPTHLELFKIPNGLNTPFDRLNVIPVVPRPSGSQRPGGFRRPTTTRRPFRKRPTVGPTTPRPQFLPVVRPQTRPPQVLPVRPQPSSPQLTTTPRPPPVTAPPTPQLPTFEAPNLQETPSIPPTELEGSQQQPSIPYQTQNQDTASLSTQNEVAPNAPQNQIPDIIGASQPSDQIPLNPSVSEPSFPEPEDTFQPLLSTPYQPSVPFGSPDVQNPVVNEPQNPSVPGLPQTQTPIVASQIQSEAQPPFEGPNLPPNPPTSPTSSSSQANTGAGGGRPQGPLVFPVGRPPQGGSSRPPFRPRPPTSAKPPNAQPPFDSGPHVPPKPPPVPATSTTSFGVNPAPPSDKPQRPLPPSRPILLNPLPPPKPPFQLTTTEKPSIIFYESSMTDDGNYSFDFLVSNSVYRKEQGFLKKSLVYPGHVVHVKTGAYSFTSPEGTFHRIDFVADEHGYRAFESTY